MTQNDGGAEGFAKIARGLSELFNFLAELDQGGQLRRGRREKDGMIIEYSFGRRTAVEAAAPQEPEPPPEAAAPRRRGAKPRARRAAAPSPLELLEPVTDVFDEPDEVVVLFELPGVSRRDIRCVLDGDILLLEARAGERLYRKEVLIEPALAAPTPQLHLRNGILEVRLAKRR